MLMGSMPGGAAPMVCIDCGVYFWFGIGLGIFFSIICALAAHHFFRR